MKLPIVVKRISENKVLEISAKRHLLQKLNESLRGAKLLSLCNCSD